MRARGRPSLPVLVARLLLLLAALSMPVSASAERADTTHCRMHHGADAGAMTHHDAQTVHEAVADMADDEPCPHCPASSCAALTTCSAPTVLDPSVSASPSVGVTTWCAAPECTTDVVGSISQEPPTRPPLVVR